MNQSSFIAGALLAGFVLYVAAKGRLDVYTNVLWGPTNASLPPFLGIPIVGPSNSGGGSGGGGTPLIPGPSSAPPSGGLPQLPDFSGSGIGADLGTLAEVLAI